MSHNVSISVPYNYVAISSAAKMLTQLADDIKDGEGTLAGDGSCYTEIPDHTQPGASSTAYDDQFAPEPDGKVVFAVPAPPTQAPAPVVPVTTATGVELDAAGLPWNGRIHASSKTKDAKGFWKYLRGVDREGLVPAIEAEMRAMMGTAVPSAPVETIAGTPPPPPPSASAAPVTTATPSTSVTTFAQLITGITSNGIDEAKVNEALAAVGITNLALLGAKADLIPTVAGHLGL